MNETPAPARPWFLYLIECRNGAYYAGIAVDVAARYASHQRGTGARYTRANPPVRLLGSRCYPDRAAASRAEWQIKRLPRADKLAYLAADVTAASSATPAQAGPIDSVVTLAS